MATVLILGGGFGGVVAAERLAQQLGDEHHITLVSRESQFIFYPALVGWRLENASRMTSRSICDGQCLIGALTLYKPRSPASI